MKTPITYYGGKQQLVKELLPLIPKHRLYVEAFAGGGALFFAKEPSEAEIINDMNGAVENFYYTCKRNFEELKQKIDSTLHSRNAHKEALYIYHNPKEFDRVTNAWAFWVVTNQGFSGKIGSWALSKDNKIGKTLFNKKLQFTTHYAERLEFTQIESKDAIKIIAQYDTAETFFYLDPPYFNSDCGHYKGYSEKDYKKLLEQLTTIKGKFLLSSYPSELLTTYIKKYGWQKKEKNQKVHVNHLSKKQKTEVMAYNYEQAEHEFIAQAKPEFIEKQKKIKTEKQKTDIALSDSACKELLEKHGERFSDKEVKKIKQLLFEINDLNK